MILNYPKSPAFSPVCFSNDPEYLQTARTVGANADHKDSWPLAWRKSQALAALCTFVPSHQLCSLWCRKLQTSPHSPACLQRSFCFALDLRSEGRTLQPGSPTAPSYPSTPWSGGGRPHSPLQVHCDPSPSNLKRILLLSPENAQLKAM